LKSLKTREMVGRFHADVGLSVCLKERLDCCNGEEMSSLILCTLLFAELL